MGKEIILYKRGNGTGNVSWAADCVGVDTRPRTSRGKEMGRHALRIQFTTWLPYPWPQVRGSQEGRTQVRTVFFIVSYHKGSYFRLPSHKVSISIL